MKKIVLVLAVLLVSVSACKNPFLKKMLVEEEKGESSAVSKHTVTFSVEGGTGGALKAEVDGKEINSGDSVEQGKSVVFTAEPAEGYVLEQWTNGGTVIAESGTDKTYTHSVTANADIKVKFQAPFVEGGASLILSPDKLDIKVKVTTADNSSVRIEGCTETSLISGTETVLHAKGSVVILKGNITELKVGAYYSSNSNKLTALNVQGLTALQMLSCEGELLTALNVQGCTALKELRCSHNRLTALNVQGLTALRILGCGDNQLTALNVQGLTALQRLYCDWNKLTELNVQGLTALKELGCGGNQLTALNVQGLTALKELGCWDNQLNADAFKKLFDDLPVRQDSDNAKCILYTEETGVTEGNHTDFTAPPDLADAFDNAKTVKKWKMYKRDGSWPGVEI